MISSKRDVKDFISYLKFQCIKHDVPFEAIMNNFDYYRKERDMDIEQDKKVIDHPQRYGGDTTYECIKVLEAWCPKEEVLGFCRCSAIKYLCRAGKKDEVVQEWKKAAWYIQKGIELMEGKE